MFAINQARKFIESNPQDPQSQILTKLVVALQSDTPFPMSSLYELDVRNFTLALQIVDEWSVDRHYAKKQKLLDVVQQLTGLDEAD